MYILGYVVEVGAVAMAIMGGWIMHRLNKKELRIDAMEDRIVIIEKSTAVQNSQLSDIRHRLKDIKETLKLLVQRHLT